MKNFAEEKNGFFSSSQVKKFSVILPNFSRQVYWSCLLRVHGKIPKEKHFFLTISFFLVLGIWPKNFWTFEQTLFVSLFKTAFEVSRGRIWSKLNILRYIEVFHHFSALKEKSSDLWVKISGTFVRFPLACPSYNSRKTLSWI